MNIVEFFVRDDEKVLAYLEDPKNPNKWNWDETYYTKQEFLEKYKHYVRIDVTNILEGN